MKTAPLSLLVLFLLCVPAFSAERISLAVMDLEAKGVPEADAEKISLIIRNELNNAKELLVLDRKQIQNGVPGASACTDLACAVQAGKKLGARKVLVGSVMRLGEQLTVICRLVDVEKGAVDFAVTQKALAESDELYMAERLSDEVTRRITGKPLYAEATGSESMPSEDIRTPVTYPSYRAVKDPTLWIGVGSTLAASWGFLFANVSYEYRTNNHFMYRRTIDWLMLSFLYYPLWYSNYSYFLAYSIADYNENRRRIVRRAERLRERNFYISAGPAGLAALMYIVFLGRSITHTVAVGEDGKAGSVSICLPPAYVEPAGMAGRNQFNVGLGLSMNF